MNIWVNGCFDVLHVGHIRLLNYAKSLGSNLMVGIDSDSRVKKLKGEDRPFNCEEDRREVLLSLGAVDEVVIFDSEEGMIGEIKKFRPDLMVVGNDYRFKDVVGEDLSPGVLFFKKIEGYSTTCILNSKSK